MFEIKLETKGNQELQMALSKFGKNVEASVVGVWPHWKESIHRIFAKTMRRGGTLNRRTGHLLKAASAGRWSFNKSGRSFEGILRLAVPYGKIQEVGTKGAGGKEEDLRSPRKGGFLTIPLSAAKTKAGVAKEKALRAKEEGTKEFFRSFIQRSRRGNLILFIRDSADQITPLWLLVESVSIPPSFWFSSSISKSIPILEKLVAGKIEEAYQL